MRWTILLPMLFALSTPLALVTSASAVNPDEILADPVLEARARDISAELRCLVCQNQSIDDSDAPLARDLRLLVRERLLEGDADSEVFEFIVARYGEFVLLKPYFGPHTIALWATAPVVLFLAIIAVVINLRRRRAEPQKAKPVPTGMTAKERDILASLQGDSSQSGKG